MYGNDSYFHKAIVEWCKKDWASLGHAYVAQSNENVLQLETTLRNELITVVYQY